MSRAPNAVPLTLALLSAGAAQALVASLADAFAARHGGARLGGRFGAVGAMREALEAGAACDVFISTAAIVDELAAAGRLSAAPRAVLGGVATALAVPAGAPCPDLSDAEALGAALLGADEIHVPDTARATAGIHFAAVLAKLGLFDALRRRLREHANGATAMREMAARAAGAGMTRHGVPRCVGCAQLTEIRATGGVELAGVLPPGHDLVTRYDAAVARGAAQPALAETFVALLGAPETRPLREAAGFAD